MQTPLGGDRLSVSPPNTLHVPMRPMQRIHLHVSKGKDMTKEEALKIIKLLSAVESWSFSMKATLPDYLHEDLCLAVERLEKIVLEKSA